MSYPNTGQEVYVSLNLSNTMLTGIGKGTITREEVSVDYLKRLFAEHGVIVSAKPEQRRLLEIVNATLRSGVWSCRRTLKLFQLSRSSTAAWWSSMCTGLRRKGGSLLPEYSEEEFGRGHLHLCEVLCAEHATMTTLVEENKKLKFELDQEVEWRNRTDN